MARKVRAYANTTVAIGRSREEIDEILRKWGVGGIQWEDDFDEGYASLRFKWKRDGDEGAVLVARFRLDMETEETLLELAIDKRTKQFSDKKYDRLKADRGKREHRILLNLLKTMFEAIEDGIMPPEALLLPWLEDSTGKTVYEKLEPSLNQLSSVPLHKALTAGDE